MKIRKTSLAYLKQILKRQPAIKSRKFGIFFKKLNSKLSSLDFSNSKHRFKIWSAIGILGFIFSSLISVVVFSGDIAGNRIVLDYNNQERIVFSDATTVEEVLVENNINISNSEIVSPSLNTAITDTDFKISINQARLIKVIDDDVQIIERIDYDLSYIDHDPYVIVQDLGYKLKHDEVANWADAEINKQGEEIPVIKIERVYTYRFVIDGQEEYKTSTKRQLSQILIDQGINKDDVIYMQPDLDKFVNTNETIYLYLKKPNQILKTETNVTIEDGIQITNESLYLITLNPNTGKEVSRQKIKNIISDYKDLEEEIFVNFGKVRNLGELNEQQKQWLNQAGVNQADWYYVDYIIYKESHWRYWIWNQQGSSAYGLCQALPSHKMATMGSDYMTNPVTQLKWCNWYALDRYGSWHNAYNFWLENHWW